MIMKSCFLEYRWGILCAWPLFLTSEPGTLPVRLSAVGSINLARADHHRNRRYRFGFNHGLGAGNEQSISRLDHDIPDDPWSQEAAIPLLTIGGVKLEILYPVGNGLALGVALANPSATQTGSGSGKETTTVPMCRIRCRIRSRFQE